MENCTIRVHVFNSHYNFIFIKFMGIILYTSSNFKLNFKSTLTYIYIKYTNK